MRWGRIAAGAALAAGAAGVAIALGGSDGDRTARGASRSTAHTATVRRRNLVDTQRVDGTLGYSGERQTANALAGTYTWLPHVGQVIGPGETLWRVDTRPVVLMDGALPAYRAMHRGDEGTDVLQLERGLSAAGYGPGAIDGTFDASTAAAVRAWQDDRGLVMTGAVELGRVVFLLGSRRVTQRAAQIGGRATPRARAHHDFDAPRRDDPPRCGRPAQCRVGARAPVELPDGTTVRGRVTSVGRVATASSDQGGGDGGDPTITVTIRLRSTKGLGRLDAAPVSVELARSRRHHVLAVPVTALIATKDGGYAVDTGSHLIAVMPGLFAGGYVEVSGVRAGTKVTVPN